MFKDRIEAGLLLAAKLKKYQNDPAVVLAVPRGGVPVAYAVARELGFPIEVILTKKVGHPMNKEYAIGAASLTDYFIVPHEEVSEEYIQQELKDIRTRLKEMYKRFMGDQDPEELEGKTLIIIDDGIATGNTILGTVYVLRKNKPGKIIIGVPVATQSAVRKLSKEVDEIVAVIIPEEFHGVGAFYEDFVQVSDEEVMYYLDKLRELRKAG
ncbi:phosphoribosyltransferase family protein [Agriterribacter sp.]|uniref:phosphoribosyltransferase n=1 Tax=Agriterribacter sp. TaxID=2821509 RepID=UPI002BF95DA8|nr:phosphoribosyltransferase family protein [Agriterribacter sp.]HRO47538.1 phosphoribosyltransferase family protein [Agriterribacter sp.]HRQ17003.1 phosphoribosyltransferase family protein [Agriterribacter sp.]